MALSPGDKLGPYEVVSLLGKGGMGEVYKARDTRLDRTVAVKVLPEHIAEREDSRARFEREARAVASLNHPNICVLHDTGSQDGAGYMVMELIEGETLAAHIKKGALPLEQALKLATQIADALDRAHRAGVTHRDVKPTNIMLTRDGVKVLDFGLAKSSSKPAPNEETLTAGLTAEGTVLGTPQYMAPEQFAGKEADARSDIWAFGAVLYQMVTGSPAFEGRTQATLIAAILGADPKPVTSFQPLIPPALVHLIDTCLAKDPEDRQQSMRDIVLELKWIAESGKHPSGATPIVSRGGKPIWMGATAIASLIACSFAFAFFARATPDGAVVRFSITPPFKAEAVDVAVSPDGKHIAFAGGASGLWLRSVDAFTAERLPGTGGALRPFWSADGRSIGFHDNGGLRSVDVDNRQNPVQTVTSGPNMFFASPWNADGVILSPPESTGTGLYQNSLSGGAPVPVTKLNASRQEITHRYPQFLPDGRHFIYWVWSALEEYSGIYAGSLDPTEKLPDGPLVRTWREGRYTEPGYLLYLQGPRLVAQRFDAAGLRLTGEPRILPELVARSSRYTGQTMLSVSPGGVLAYQESAPEPGARIVWRDREGKHIRSIDAPPRTRGSYHLSLASDEKRVVVTADDENTLEDLWVVDLERATYLRLTATHGSSVDSIWAPDGRRVAFRSNRSGVYDLYGKDGSGTGDEELVVKSPHYKVSTDWSPDGRFLVYHEIDPKTKHDIWVAPLDGDRKPFPFVKTEFVELGGKLSPVPDSDGHLWMAYNSNETGQYEIYIRPFLPGAPGGPAGARVRVSTGGGVAPQWRKDGRELFYIGNQDGKRSMMAVDVKLGKSTVAGGPRALFELVPGAINWAPMADGRRFLFIEPAGEPALPKINVVLNWAAELTKAELKTVQ